MRALPLKELSSPPMERVHKQRVKAAQGRSSDKSQRTGERRTGSSQSKSLGSHSGKETKLSARDQQSVTFTLSPQHPDKKSNMQVFGKIGNKVLY
mmetsp:Transcript_38918/g.59139  ORF Transcript_38918/g.59139 Transcript_38918/m.59139 type:complete len:95 (-) Transcript_38918:3499-3783(-)